jgi:hypothetical protein
MSSPERSLLQRRFLIVSAAVLLTAGFGLTLLIFYPGVMTYDAKFVYEDIAKGTMGDWQSPVMARLWGLIDPIAPGAASMFLLIAATYWLGFGVLSLCARVSGQGQPVVTAAAGNDAAGASPCRDHLARRHACSVLVACRNHRVRGV